MESKSFIVFDPSVRREVSFDAGRIDLSGMHLTKLPKELAICKNLTWLDLSDNCLTELEDIPDGVRTLILSGNRELKRISRFPACLKTLHFDACTMERLPKLPEGLEILSLNRWGVRSGLKELPPLPTTLKKLWVYSIGATQLGLLPDALEDLTIAGSKVESLENFPKSLKHVLAKRNDPYVSDPIFKKMVKRRIVEFRC